MINDFESLVKELTDNENFYKLEKYKIEKFYAINKNKNMLLKKLNIVNLDIIEELPLYIFKNEIINFSDIDELYITLDYYNHINNWSKKRINNYYVFKSNSKLINNLLITNNTIYWFNNKDLINRLRLELTI